MRKCLRRHKLATVQKTTVVKVTEFVVQNTCEVRLPRIRDQLMHIHARYGLQTFFASNVGWVSPQLCLVRNRWVKTQPTHWFPAFGGMTEIIVFTEFGAELKTGLRPGSAEEVEEVFAHDAGDVGVAVASVA